MAATRVFTNLCRNVGVSRQFYLQYMKKLDVLRRPISYSASLCTERKYTDKHEWVSNSDGVCTVGISDYAQEALGDIVYAQLPDLDSEFNQGDECGALESVKAASEIYCPVSGKVTEINTEVEEQPSLINRSCYEKGWLFKLKMSEPKEMDNLLNEEQYKTYVKSLET